MEDLGPRGDWAVGEVTQNGDPVTAATMPTIRSRLISWGRRERARTARPIPPSGRFWSVVLLAAVSGASAVILTRAAWADPSLSVIGGASDGVQTAWFMAWLSFALQHHMDPLVTSYLSPAGHPIYLMRNTSVPFWGLVMMPVTLAAGALFSFNVALALSLAAGPVATALVFERYVVHRWTAWTAGFLYGLCPFALAEADLGHLLWVSLWFPPLVMVLLEETFVRQTKRPLIVGGALGLLVTSQLLISEESVATTAVVAAFMLVGLSCVYRSQIRARADYALRTMGVAALVATLSSAPTLWSEFLAPGRVLHSVSMNPLLFSADLLGFILPSSHQLLSPGWASTIAARFTGDSADTTVYLGFPLVLGLLMGCTLCRSSARVRWSVVLTLVSLVLSLGSRLHIGGRILAVPLPWAVLSHLPLLNLAMPSRVVVPAMLGATWCLALVMDRLWASGRTLARAGALTLIGSAFIFWAPQSALYVQRIPDPPFFRGPDRAVISRGSYVAVAPVPNGGNQADAMAWQMMSGFRFRMPWGYAIQSSAGGQGLVGAPNNPVIAGISASAAGHPPPASVAKVSLMTLRRWHVRTVLVGAMVGQSRVVAWLMQVLKERPTWYGRVAVWQLRSIQPVDGAASAARR